MVRSKPSPAAGRKTWEKNPRKKKKKGLKDCLFCYTNKNSQVEQEIDWLSVINVITDLTQELFSD